MTHDCMHRFNDRKPGLRLVSSPDPSPEKQKEGSNGVKNVIITFPVHVHRTAGILDLVLDDVLQSDLSSLIGSYDKKSRSEHQTLFLARAGKGWARD